MPRSIENLGPPPVGFRADDRTDHPSGDVTFETPEASRGEDESRRRDLIRFHAQQEGGRKLRRAMPALAQFLDSVSTGTAHRLSAASSVQMRDWRIRVIGWLWSLIAQLDSDDEWVFFTIVLPSWWVPSRDLRQVRAKRLMERLRVALQRAGSKNATGWLYAKIDGEFDGTTNGFTPHVHGIATKGMIQVLRRLRKQRQYKRQKSDQRRYPLVSVMRKLRIDPSRGSAVRAISYAAKSFWLQCNSYLDEKGKRRRHELKYRITGKHAVRYLLWLHRERVKDQVLLVHLSVVDGELVAGKRGAK